MPGSKGFLILGLAFVIRFHVVVQTARNIKPTETLSQCPWSSILVVASWRCSDAAAYALLCEMASGDTIDSDAARPGIASGRDLWCRGSGFLMSNEPMSDAELLEAQELRIELLGVLGVRDGLNAQLHDEAVHFLALCVRCAQSIKKMPDVYAARRLMLEVTVWATELKTRLDKETYVQARPKDTARMFKR